MPRQRLTQQKLDLRIDAAQIIRGPLLELVPEILRDSQQESLALRRHRSGVERAGVDDGRHFVVAAEHDQQIAHHRRPALVIEPDGLLIELT